MDEVEEFDLSLKELNEIQQDVRNITENRMGELVEEISARYSNKIPMSYFFYEILLELYDRVSRHIPGKDCRDKAKEFIFDMMEVIKKQEEDYFI